MEHELAAAFLSSMRGRCAPLSPAKLTALEALLRSTCEDAHAQWPTVALPPKQFVIYLAQRLPEPEGLEDFAPLLEKMSLGELYLACACFQGLPSAHEAFESHYLAKLPAKLKRLNQPEDELQDVCQLTRVKLLVDTPESAPKIGKYTGTGSLLSWVIVTAGRIATKRRATDNPPSNDEIIQIPGPAQGEWDFIQQSFHAEFRQALREAFAKLSAEELHLLRLHFVHRLSTYKLADLFRVNQSTICRWLQDARQSVYEETRNQLQERLGLSTRDLNSHLLYVNSQLDLSISQLLGERSVAPPPTPPTPPTPPMPPAIAATPPPIATTPPPIPPKNG